MLKIITVCGMGVGSSLILKMTVEKAMTNLGKKCSVEHWDMGTVKGKECDIIVTTVGFKKQFQDQENVVYITNIVDTNEVQTKLEEFLNK